MRQPAAAAAGWLLGQVRARVVGHGYSYPRAAVDGAASGAPFRSANGKGVRLQKYKDGGLSDATTFVLEAGLSWKDPAGRTRTESDLADWTAKRATAGRMAPRGFPRDNRFN